MANKKISDLSAIGSLSGTELLEILQGGVNKKGTILDLIALGGVLDLVSASTANPTITLTFGSGIAAYRRAFYGSASFAGPKTIALASDTVANHFTFIFEITDLAAALTFPASFKSGDTRWISLVWTATETGIFKATGDKYGSTWIVEFSLLPAV